MKYILEVGCGEGKYLKKRAEKNPNALIIALEIEKMDSKEYPDNVVFGLVDLEKKYLGLNIKDEKKKIDLNIKKNMFGEAYINHVFLSPELKRAYDRDLKRGIKEIIENTCEVMKEDSIIIVTDKFDQIFASKYKNLIKERMKKYGFKHTVTNEDIHSLWGEIEKSTNKCIYFSRNEINEKKIEQIRKYKR